MQYPDDLADSRGHSSLKALLLAYRQVQSHECMHAQSTYTVMYVVAGEYTYIRTWTFTCVCTYVPYLCVAWEYIHMHVLSILGKINNNAICRSIRAGLMTLLKIVLLWIA